MKLYQVTDPEFAPYGRVVNAPADQLNAIITALREKTPLPDNTGYVAEEPVLQCLPEAEELGVSLYGGMPVQFGWCNGHNTKLNCLEYHRDSEFNLGAEDFVLLLAKQEEIVADVLDTANVKGFRVPAGVLVEVYATSLHYAPCHTDAAKGFKVLVALPKGTNTEKPLLPGCAADDKLLWARNKWLLAHPDTAEAAAGAVKGLRGVNIDIAAE